MITRLMIKKALTMISHNTESCKPVNCCESAPTDLFLPKFLDGGRWRNTICIEDGFLEFNLRSIIRYVIAT